MVNLILGSQQQTHFVGKQIGKNAHAGAVIALIGDLGAGKTVFTKGVAVGLEITNIITSPTFVLMMLHESGRLPLYHVDLYRLSDDSEAELIGIPEAVEGEGITVIEWANLFPDLLPRDHLSVTLQWLDSDTRIMQVEAKGPLHKHLEDLLIELQ